jgi:putative CocE/NonD family hydrolase
MNAPARQARAGERTFGPGAAVDYDELLLRFLDHHVRGIDNGVGSEKRARVFVMGEDAWREGDTWPLPGTQSTTLYLAPGDAGRGRLTLEAPSGAATRAFVSDPAVPVVDAFPGSPGAHDYRGLAERPDVLVFETEPLVEDRRVVGPIRAEMQVSTDAPDFDLWIKLHDVAPDGTAWNLMSSGLDVQRASYRDGGPERKLLKPREVYTLRFENLMTGNLFRKGHRIRVVLAGSFFPAFSSNLQTGELETTASVARKARVNVHCGPGSRIVLPVVP